MRKGRIKKDPLGTFARFNPSARLMARCNHGRLAPGLYINKDALCREAKAADQDPCMQHYSNFHVSTNARRLQRMSVRVTVFETGTHWKHSVARPRQLYAGPPLAAGRTSLVPCSYPFETHFANEDGWIGWMDATLSSRSGSLHACLHGGGRNMESCPLAGAGARQAGCYRGTYRVCVLGQGRLCKVKAG